MTQENYKLMRLMLWVGVIGAAVLGYIKYLQWTRGWETGWDVATAGVIGIASAAPLFVLEVVYVRGRRK